MKHVLIIIAAVVLVGCGESQQLATAPKEQAIEPTAEVPAQQLAPAPEAKLLIWGNTGDGIEIDNDGKTMVRRSKNEKPYCGSISKYPVPSDKLINLRFDSSSGRMFCYVGLTSNDVDVDRWSGKQPESWCVYFSDGNQWAGMHDSEYANTNNASDWRGGVVPVVKNSEKISIIYSTAQKKVTFFKNDEAVYVGNGFEGDLYLFGAVKYPEEAVTILE